MLNIQLQPGDLQGDIVPLETSPQGVQKPSITLRPGNSWYSPSNAYRLTFLDLSGELMWQVVDVARLPPWKQGQELNPTELHWLSIWSAFIALKGPTQVDMQIDGNLVAYAGPTAVFDTRTDQYRHAFLRPQDDGNLVIYDSAGVAVWNTVTSVWGTAGNNFDSPFGGY